MKILRNILSVPVIFVLAAMTLIAWGLLEAVNQLADFALEAEK